MRNDEEILEALLVLQKFQRGETVGTYHDIGQLLICCLAASLRGWLSELRITYNDAEAKTWPGSSGGPNLRFRIKLSRLGKKELEVFTGRTGSLE